MPAVLETFVLASCVDFRIDLVLFWTCILCASTTEEEENDSPTIPEHTSPSMSIQVVNDSPEIVEDETPLVKKKSKKRVSLFTEKSPLLSREEPMYTVVL